MVAEGEERICPLCGQDNNCQHGEGSCWCQDFKIPQYILDMVPKPPEKSGVF
ncbi:MAG: cysteine-rich CWC family protein [Bacillota bacterium]|nr:cysteine-rich CWC family protein [Bacillota bacterium]MDW7684744.1 cysteine-rich CWC family protein [Bacillota bacterium]